MSEGPGLVRLWLDPLCPFHDWIYGSTEDELDLSFFITFESQLLLVIANHGSHVQFYKASHESSVLTPHHQKE